MGGCTVNLFIVAKYIDWNVGDDAGANIENCLHVITVSFK